MKLNFTKHGVITMHAELSATRERVRELFLVKKTAASHGLDQMNHLQLLQKLAA